MRIRIIVLPTILCLALSGCGQGGAKSPGQNSGPKTEIVVSMGGWDTGLIGMGRFDPKKRWGVHNNANILHSTLLKKTAKIEFVGDLSKNYTVSDDGLTWSFEIFDNHVFSNGEKLTAEDVKFTYDTMKKDSGQHDLSFVEQVDVPGPDQVTFKLSRPMSTFVSQLSEIGIVPRKHYNDNYSTNPIGSGPYMVAQQDEGQQVIFQVNPHWHGKPPHFKKFTALFQDAPSAVASAKAGKVDAIYVDPTLADTQLDGWKLIEVETTDIRGLSLPFKAPGQKTDGPDSKPVGNPVTNDVAVRKALNIGLDRQALIDVALKGRGKPAYSIVDGMPWFNEETVVKDGRTDEAKRLLDAAGWTPGADGIRQKGSVRAELKLYYPSDDELRTTLALTTAEQAKKLGIKMDLVGSHWDKVRAVGHSEVLLYGGGRHHPYQFYTMHSPKVAGQGWNNHVFYDNPTVNRYMDEALAATDMKEANRLWKLAQWDGTTGTNVPGDAAYAWLVRFNHTYLTDKRIDVREQPIHSHGHEWQLLWNISEWTWKN